MGLLDSLLYNPETYGGQGGGLLDFLRNAQMQNSQYQPTQNGFSPPSAPQAAPSQTQPIQVGGVQMPRLGNADLYNPQQVNTPPNAQPTQGQIPPQVTDANAQAPAPQAAPQLPPALGGGISALGRIGNPDGLIARLTGNDPRSIAQQNLRAEYEATRQALIGNGTDPNQANRIAMLAVMNKDAGKVVLPELLSNRQKFEKLKDGFGNEVPVFVDTVGHTVTDANGKPYGQGGSGASGDLQAITDNIAKMRESGATREQMLKQIPNGYRDDVEALVTGKAIPANMGRAQVRGTLNILAHAVDKDYDEQMIPARIQMRKDFAGEGKNGQAIGAFNTVQHHADQVSDAINEFEKAGGGSDSPLWNAGKLLLANNTSYDPKLRDAAQKLKDKLNATEHEVASAYNAGHLSDHDLKTWNEIKAENLPAGQLKQKLADFVDLVNGKRDSLNHMYRTTFHEDAPAIDKEANSATTAKIHQRLPQYGGGASSGLPQGWSYKGSR